MVQSARLRRAETYGGRYPEHTSFGKDVAVPMAMLLVLFVAALGGVILVLGWVLLRGTPAPSGAMRETVSLVDILEPRRPVVTETSTALAAEVVPLPVEDEVDVETIAAVGASSVEGWWAEEILTVRAALGLGWTAMANEVGVAPATIRGWSTGKQPSPANLDRLTAALARYKTRIATDEAEAV